MASKFERFLLNSRVREESIKKLVEEEVRFQFSFVPKLYAAFSLIK